MDLSQRSVLVLGLGESGLAMARWCAEEGARVRVADSRSEPRLAPVLRAAHGEVSLVLGAFTTELLEGVDLVAISPGLSPHEEPQRALLEQAGRDGIAVVGEIELFAGALAQLRSASGYAPQILAVTGTNGKTTVTSLAGSMCRRAGKHTLVAGNIGPPALEALRDARTRGTLPDIWVLELSSFQLHSAVSLAPDAAAFLNLSEDHLDWHGSMDAYLQDKLRIFAKNTARVLNRADTRVMAASRSAGPARVLTFGLDAPSGADSFGVVDYAGVRWLAMTEGATTAAAPGRRVREPPVAAESVRRLMPQDALLIRGAHNAANALAALALCAAAGLPMAPLLHALREYQGEPHRLQLVTEIAGVEYFDDSKGTNVGATVAALLGLGRTVVLIAGGDGKGQDFTALAAPVAAHARAVVLIGRDAGLLRAALASAAEHVELVDCTTLEAAVHVAAERAQPGDAVLLSPACASLDMFTDYRHRARVFRSAVLGRASAERSPC